jgi:ABC-2 type transport system ATP-binding protein
MLYGSLREVRQKFAKPALEVATPDPLPEQIKGVSEVQKQNGSYILHLTNGETPQDILKFLIAANVKVEKFEIALPTLDEIFIEVVKKQGQPH